MNFSFSFFFLLFEIFDRIIIYSFELDLFNFHRHFRFDNFETQSNPSSISIKFVYKHFARYINISIVMMFLFLDPVWRTAYKLRNENISNIAI